MEDDVLRSRFEGSIDGWVRAALQRGARSLPDLLRILPGVYPTEVLGALGRLGDGLPAGWHEGSPRSKAASIKDGWPIEHPLDFDWRFTSTTTRFLLNSCAGAVGCDLVLLGSPSLAREASDRRWPGKITLFDRNESLVAAIKGAFPAVDASRRDLVWGEAVPEEEASVAVADPPWYPEYALAFLWSAARLTRIGGRVLLSAPPQGTRAGILEERRSILDQAGTFGLRVASIRPAALAYRTPNFERNSLSAAGVTSIPSAWRRGDLVEFEVAHKPAIPRPFNGDSPKEWREVSIGNVRIKLRPGTDAAFGDPTLTPAIQGGMLTSVSRRDPARALADVWTSGNRIFRCQGTGILCVMLSALARGGDVIGAVETAIGKAMAATELEAIRLATFQILELISREEREIADYGHRRNERGLVEAI